MRLRCTAYEAVDRACANPQSLVHIVENFDQMANQVNALTLFDLGRIATEASIVVQMVHKLAGESSRNVELAIELIDGRGFTIWVAVIGDANIVLDPSTEITMELVRNATQHIGNAIDEIHRAITQHRINCSNPE